MNYRHVYMLIIEHAKSEQLQGIRKRGNGEYYENHHILPKSLFPLWKNRKPNQVLLTAREHFFCHQLLTKIYPTKEMYSALSIFCKFKQNKRKLASRQYETCKKAASKASYLRWADSEFKTKVSISMKNAAALKDFSFMQTDEYKEIHRNISHNSKWYNDGINEYFVQIPQDGWILGRLKRSKEIIAKTAQKRKETRMNRSDDEKQKEYKNRSNASKEKHKRWKESGVNIYIKGN